MAIPTTWSVKYACGHSAKRDLSNFAPSKRKSAAATFFKDRANDGKGMVCPKCFKEQGAGDREKFLNQLSLDAAQFATEHDLPELTGTDKQVASGLVESAKRDRFVVLDELLDPERSEYPGDSEIILASARRITRAGWWTNNLGYKARKEEEYGQEEFKELIIDGAQEQIKYEQALAEREHIEPENPFEWAGDVPEDQQGAS